MTALELDALAKSLKLTRKQRLFAEALAKDPERNQSEAARAAGSSRPTEAGSRWMRERNVTQYIAALTATAEKAVVRRTGKVVADLAETLGISSAIARGETPAKRMVKAEDGSVEVYEPMKGAGPLLDWYGKDKQPPINLNVWMGVLQNANGDVRPAAKRLLELQQDAGAR